MKALLLSTHMGGGHDAAARAMEKALTTLGVECRLMDCVAFAGERTSRVVSNTYIQLAKKYPKGFGVIYRMGAFISTPRHKSVVYLANSLYGRQMAQAIQAYGPDMIVSTHLFGGMTVTHLKNAGQITCLTAFVMTDYTCCPFTEDVGADVYLIPHPDLIPQCVSKGFPADRLCPWGIPVDPDCRPTQDRAAAKAALGIPKESRHVVLAGGSMGAGNLPQTVGHILPALGQRDALTVICGSNEEARRAVAALGEPRVKALGRVTPLTPYMAGADVLVTKAGGLTTTEAMTVGVPLVIVHPIEGVETANAAFFERQGAAAYARQPEALPALIRQAFDPAYQRKMLACQRGMVIPGSAQRFAQRLMALAEEHPKA